MPIIKMSSNVEFSSLNSVHTKIFFSLTCTVIYFESFTSLFYINCINIIICIYKPLDLFFQNNPSEHCFNSNI